MKKAYTLFAVLLLSSLFAVAQARQAPLVERERITFAANDYTLERVRTAIIAGGAQHGWELVVEAPGKLILKFDKGGKHQVRVNVLYDTSGYQIQYLDSVNLNYGMVDGQVHIHPNYNRWISNLIKSIGVAAAIAR